MADEQHVAVVHDDGHEQEGMGINHVGSEHTITATDASESHSTVL